MRTDFMLNVNRSADDIIIKGYVDDDNQVIITEPDIGGGESGGGSYFINPLITMEVNYTSDNVLAQPIAFDGYIINENRLEYSHKELEANQSGSETLITEYVPEEYADVHGAGYYIHLTFYGSITIVEMINCEYFDDTGEIKIIDPDENATVKMNVIYS